MWFEVRGFRVRGFSLIKFMKNPNQKEVVGFRQSCRVLGFGVPVGQACGSRFEGLGLGVSVLNIKLMKNPNLKEVVGLKQSCRV